MSPIDEVLKEYINMRQNGLDTKEALRALRAYVDRLPQAGKERLAQQMKAWEAQQQGRGASPIVPLTPPTNPPTKPPTESTKSSVIKPLSGAPSKPATQPPLAPKTNPPAAPNAITWGHSGDTDVWVECSNCSKKNRVKDVFCYSCGHMLEGVADHFDTKTFGEATSELYSDEFFGADSVMVLSARSGASQARFEVRPQMSSRDVVLGRSAESQTVRPDVDLSEAEASSLGVSRLHIAFSYDAKNDTIQIKDLGSANGSYVNGQRVLPTELRVLRNGDELRLGRLVLRVTFHHPGRQL